MLQCCSTQTQITGKCELFLNFHVNGVCYQNITVKLVANGNNILYYKLPSMAWNVNFQKLEKIYTSYVLENIFLTTYQ